jgi:hypothetical protein
MRDAHMSKAGVSEEKARLSGLAYWWTVPTSQQMERVNNTMIQNDNVFFCNDKNEIVTYIIMLKMLRNDDRCNPNSMHMYPMDDRSSVW